MDNIRPEHYAKCSIECWDAMKLILGTDGFISFCLGNAFKYLWRYKHKNGKEDLDKANIYLCVAEKNVDDNTFESTKEQIKNMRKLYEQKTK